ncbi:Uncharacterised protein [Bordetella ansorpii]|uniref:Uncharacterized protein n=1 Tax=Bordetella ansorpii TaxID=288768 RepID=A0A157SJP3_9BORD|nr:hypothetical protein [Bordetella ansorpii]SAI70481.1 Uncharacterised protein [Bordetella ansorpii]
MNTINEQWQELEGAWGLLLGLPELPTRQHRIADEDRSERRVFSGCRCWRCFPGTGGVAQGDRRTLDRILGAHLARMPDDDRERFLSDWTANPRHGLKARAVLQAWVRIAQGSTEFEPVYPEAA